VIPLARAIPERIMVTTMRYTSRRLLHFTYLSWVGTVKTAQRGNCHVNCQDYSLALELSTKSTVERARLMTARRHLLQQLAAVVALFLSIVLSLQPQSGRWWRVPIPRRWTGVSQQRRRFTTSLQSRSYLSHVTFHRLG